MEWVKVFGIRSLISINNCCIQAIGVACSCEAGQGIWNGNQEIVEQAPQKGQCCVAFSPKILSNRTDNCRRLLVVCSNRALCTFVYLYNLGLYHRPPTMQTQSPSCSLPQALVVLSLFAAFYFFWDEHIPERSKKSNFYGSYVRFIHSAMDFIVAANMH